MQQQAETHRQRADGQLARNIAQTAAIHGNEPAAPGYWDVIGDPDIKRDRSTEYLDQFLATEMSDKFALGNITYDDWRKWTWQIEQEFWTMQNELKDQACKLDAIDMATMYGSDRVELTDERARRLRSAMQVKKMMTSLSVNAQGLRSGTEIHVATKNESERENEDDEPSGRLARARKWLGR